MTFIFEIHELRPFYIEVNHSGFRFCLWFTTFLATSKTMPEIIGDNVMGFLRAHAVALAEAAEEAAAEVRAANSK